jgi:hypothetical protein
LPKLPSVCRGRRLQPRLELPVQGQGRADAGLLATNSTGVSPLSSKPEDGETIMFERT